MADDDLGRLRRRRTGAGSVRGGAAAGGAVVPGDRAGERRARVHPVTPIFTADGLYLFMEPTSPKAADLRERGWFALHNGVPDNAGTGGEASVSGTGHPVDDAAVRATVVAAASYDPADRYVLFELRPTEVRCNGYGDVTLPERRRWRADA